MAMTPCKTQKAFSRSSIITNSHQILGNYSNLATFVKETQLRIYPYWHWDSRSRFPINITVDFYKNLCASAPSQLR